MLIQSDIRFIYTRRRDLKCKYDFSLLKMFIPYFVQCVGCSEHLTPLVHATTSTVPYCTGCCMYRGVNLIWIFLGVVEKYTAFFVARDNSSYRDFGSSLLPFVREIL